MDIDAIKSAIDALPFGKRLPGATYVFDAGGEGLPVLLRNMCAELRRRFLIGPEYNVLKFHTTDQRVSFLSYPTFLDEAHPALVASVVIHLVTGRVRRDDYRGRANPPILHRKEAFVPHGDPHFELFSSLTKAEEGAGLLDETSHIGFRSNWERLLAAKGVKIVGHQLVSGANAVQLAQKPSETAVDRHRTAIVRTEMSKPVKVILEQNQLRVGDSFFDYGCGLGGDVRSLRSLGYAAQGWDPNHAPENVREPADVVNLGFVLNVIEDPAERVEVLANAWSLTKRLLVVSTLVRGQEGYAEFRCFGDGLLTSRNTFQKFFEPAEIQALIEDVLDCEAVPVAMGIYFAFRSTSDSQDFLAHRVERFIDWGALSARLGLRRALRSKADPYDSNRELLDDFWNTTVRLGRTPRDDEFHRLDEVRTACGSLPKAMSLFVERFGQATFDAARARRREDTLVYVAAGRLRKRVPFNRLSVQLQRDIKSFFGSYPEAERQAIDVMFAAGDVDELALAIQNLGFGWWDAVEQQFTVHRSLLDELPTILRVYVECGARLFGNPREADLIKFHLRSRKLTFQLYDDFDGAPFPELKLRVKIDLPKLFVTVLDQEKSAERQILYFKERFVSESYPHRAAFLDVSQRMRELGFDPTSIGYGPSRSEFERLVHSRGLNWDLTGRKQA